MNIPLKRLGACLTAALLLALPASAFEAFDSLSPGEINGQNGWTIDAADSAKATVKTSALSYSAADGAVLDGGLQHLALNGSPDAKMNNWLSKEITPELFGSTYVRAMISSSDAGTDTNPGELFMRLAGWNAYVAAKFKAGTIELPGGNILEVDTANGLPLDETHMVVIRMVVDTGSVKRIDLWLNPSFADEASPDLSATGLNIAIASIDTLELRSQNTLTRVDEIQLSQNWFDVVPEVEEFLVADFEDLSPGEIDGQDGWAIDPSDTSKATVAPGSLNYMAADGALINGGMQHLALNGAPDAKMNNWLGLPIDPLPDGSAYVRFLVSSSDLGTSTDPGELFMRLAGWNLYTAVKFNAGTLELPGARVLEVDTTNGLPLDMTHMVVMRLNVDQNVVKSINLWLNPSNADINSPDLTATGLNVNLSQVATLEFRSQNTLTRVDQVLIVEQWTDAVPERTAFYSAPFDNLAVGEVSGQDGWTIDAADAAKATVSTGGLTYTSANGAALDGGIQHLALNGSPSAKMNKWLSTPIDPPTDGTTYVRALIRSDDKGVDTDPGELFMRLAGWNLYVAAKFFAGVIETPGGGLLEVDTANGLPLDVTHMVVLRLNATGGQVKSVDVWLNPDAADYLTPDLTVGGLSVDLATINKIEMRSQNTLTRVDELLVTASWADAVPVPTNILDIPFDNLDPGQIAGQDNWSIDDPDTTKATVETGSLSYASAGGVMVDGGIHHLALNGAPDAKMNKWLSRPIPSPENGETYIRMLLNSSDLGISTDPGELFMRLAGWNLYVAAKFFAGVIETPGGGLLEVDTANGLPLDTTHMVILRLNASGGNVTSIDLWLNPEYADSPVPDLTVSGLSVATSAISKIEMRSQNTLTRVDEMRLAKTWDDVVPMPATLLSQPFDNLALGEINGQDGWTIDAADTAKATVESGSLSYMSADGSMVDGGTQHLALTGSPDAKMNKWLTLPVSPALDETTYVRTLISSADKGTSSDPGEFFMRLAGWSLYVAAKFNAGVIETPGGGLLEVDTTNGLPLDVAHMVVLRLNASNGVVTSVDLWLNPDSADQISPDLTVGSLSLDLSAITKIEMRSQNTLTRVDELLLAKTWSAVVPEPGTYLYEPFDNLALGEISGQDGWSIDAADTAKATVESGALSYLAADGAFLDGGTQHLALTGSPDAKMNKWLMLPVEPALESTTYMRALISSSDLGVSTAPGELFMRLAGWNLYVAAKFFAGVIETPGGGLLEVDTLNGLPLDVTHMIVLRLNATGGMVTSIDLWLNPTSADAGAPDLTVGGLSVALSAITQLELRSQNTLTRVDELLFTESWADVVPEPTILLSQPFDNLALGEINGQDGWSIDAADTAKATVESGALNYTAPDGAALSGGTQHLALAGSPDAKMNKWLTLPIDPAFEGTTYMRALISSSDAGASANPGELFMRLAGWNLYVAAKFFAGVIETPGGGLLEVDTANGLPLDVAHMVVLRLNVSGGTVTSIDLWLNPAYADSSEPDLSVGGLSVDVSAISKLELRSQNTLTRVDELLFAETWADVVPEFDGPVIIGDSFDGLAIGEINGQGGWSINEADAAKANVAAGSLTYTAADGAVLEGGTQHLVLSGSPDAKMNNWLTWQINPPLDGTTYMRALISSSDKGVSANPGELFMRLAGWNLYVAAKYFAGVIELPGGNVLEVDTENGLPLDVTHMVLLRLNVEAGVVTSVDLWLNPEFADAATPDLSASGLSVDLSAITQLELRSQNTEIRVDEILFAKAWEEMVPEAAEPTAPSILSGPASASIEVGDSVTFSVTASGTAPLAYQWRKDGTDIEGATGSSYTITDAQLDDAGSFDVVVSNSVDSVTSDPATLEVNEPVIVTLVSVFSETFDSGTSPETAAPVDLTSLGWNVHHSYAGVYLNGLETGSELPGDILVLETSTEIGDPDNGEPHGYVGFFINNYPLYGEGEEGARPALPGAHPDTGMYYSNRTLAHFLWTETELPADTRDSLREFNFVQGNRDASEHNFFPAVRIDGQWYVYVVDQETLGTDVRILGRPGQAPNGAETVFSGSQFSENGEYANYYNAQPYSFEWSESGWTPLTFDGATGVNSTVGMVLEDPLEGALPAGDITAVGVYAPENIDPGYNFNGFRVDSIELLAEAPEAADLFTFTFNNEGTVDGADRPIQAGNWDGMYSSAALPLETGTAVYADLSEGVTSDTTPGHYKAGFLFVSGKTDQPAPEGFFVYSTNTNVVDVVQTPASGVNPQTDWYSDPVNTVTDLSQLTLEDLRELQMRIRPRNMAIRYHFAIQVGGDWYVSEEAFQHSGVGDDWESVSLNVQTADWLSGVIGESSINFDFTATAPTVVGVDDIGLDAMLGTVGIYIDTDDGVGQSDSWARVDSITLSAVLPPVTAPVITSQPENVAVVAGETATFTVAVQDPEGVSYQWRKDGVVLAGETEATLTLANVASADAGTYTVLVSGPGGDVVSEGATLEVYAAPIITPLLIEVDAGQQDELITITANAAIDWTAVSQSDWITVVFGESGSGDGLVQIQIAANVEETSRTGSLLVAGVTVTVNQEAFVPEELLPWEEEGLEPGDQVVSPWFGAFQVGTNDWLKHSELGWIWIGFVETSDNMWIYSYVRNAWLWSAEGTFPVVYDSVEESWIYFFVIPGGSWVYSYSTGEWTQVGQWAENP